MAQATRHVIKQTSPLIRSTPKSEKTKIISNEIIEFPKATWTFAAKQSDGRTLPQIIAHRGYKAAYPENSMAAFRAAVEAGSHCIETDVHVTRDGVVVLSHDGNLKRCFGVDTNIVDLDWAQIEPLRSIRAPHEPMPRLVDLLRWLGVDDVNKGGGKEVWLLLDIKPDVDPSFLLPHLRDALSVVPPHPARPWTRRVVLGVWAARYLPLLRQHLPGYATTHITFSAMYSRFAFLPHQNVGFNALMAPLALGWGLGPGWLSWGTSFVQQAHTRGRPVTVWTVNEPEEMRLACALGVDGIITDDPPLLAKVCEEWRVSKNGQVPFDWRAQVKALISRALGVHVLILLVIKDVLAAFSRRINAKI